MSSSVISSSPQSSGKVVRSFLETLASAESPQIANYVQNEKGPNSDVLELADKYYYNNYINKEKPSNHTTPQFSEMSTRTNKVTPIYSSPENPSAVMFLSPPNAKDKKKRAASTGACNRKKDGLSNKGIPENKMIPHNQCQAQKPPLLPVIKRMESTEQVDAPSSGNYERGNLITREEADAEFKQRLNDYERKRDAEEEIILKQLTNDITLLEADNVNLDEQNQLLVKQVESLRKESCLSKAAEEEAKAQMMENHAKSAKSIKLLKQKCVDLTKVTTELHQQNKDNKSKLITLQSELLISTKNNEGERQLSKDELNALQQSFEDREKSLEAESRLLRQQLEAKTKDLQDADRLIEQVEQELKLTSKEHSDGITRIRDLEEQLSDLQSTTSSLKSKLLKTEQHRGSLLEEKYDIIKEQSAKLKQLDESCKTQSNDLRKKMHQVVFLEGELEKRKNETQGIRKEFARFHEAIVLLSTVVNDTTRGAQEAFRGIDNLMIKLIESDASEKEQAKHLSKKSSTSSLPISTLLCFSLPRKGPSNSDSRDLPFDDGIPTPAMVKRCTTATSDVMQLIKSIGVGLKECKETSDRAFEAHGLSSLERKANKARIIELEKNVENLKAEIEQQRADHRQTEVALRDLEKGSSELTLEFQRQQKVNEEQQAAIIILKETNVSSQQLYQKATSILEEERLACSTEKTKIAVLSAELQIASESESKARKALAETTEAFGKLSSDYSNLTREHQQIVATHDRLQKQLKKAQDERDESKEIILVNEKEITILKNKIRVVESQLSGAKKRGMSSVEYKSLEAEIRILNQKIGAVDSEKKAIEAKHALEMNEALAKIREGVNGNNSILRRVYIALMGVVDDFTEICGTVTKYNTLEVTLSPWTTSENLIRFTSSHSPSGESYQPSLYMAIPTEEPNPIDSPLLDLSHVYHDSLATENMPPREMGILSNSVYSLLAKLSSVVRQDLKQKIQDLISSKQFLELELDTIRRERMTREIPSNINSVPMSPYMKISPPQTSPQPHSAAPHEVYQSIIVSNQQSHDDNAVRSNSSPAPHLPNIGTTYYIPVTENNNIAQCSLPTMTNVNKSSTSSANLLEVKKPVHFFQRHASFSPSHGASSAGMSRSVTRGMDGSASPPRPPSLSASLNQMRSRSLPQQRKPMIELVEGSTVVGQ